jgi:hypothetical protein
MSKDMCTNRDQKVEIQYVFHITDRPSSSRQSDHPEQTPETALKSIDKHKIHKRRSAATMITCNAPWG